jgi:hypothetical protein
VGASFAIFSSALESGSCVVSHEKLFHIKHALSAGLPVARSPRFVCEVARQNLFWRRDRNLEYVRHIVWLVVRKIEFEAGGRLLPPQLLVRAK